MEKKIAELRVHVKAEREKLFYPDTQDRWYAADKGPIRSNVQFYI